jgi:adenylyltransferase/sulfurtransferase
MELDERGLPRRYRFRDDLEVTPRQAREALLRGEALLLDCRQPFEHELARIEGDVFIPMHEVLDRVEELEPRDRPIIVYCHHGVRSISVTLALRRLGFADVRSLAGGIDLWSIDVDPTVPRY